MNIITYYIYVQITEHFLVLGKLGSATVGLAASGFAKNEAVIANSQVPLGNQFSESWVDYGSVLEKNVLKKWPRETHQVLLQGLTARSKYSKSTRIYAARRQRSRSPKVKHLSEVTLWSCVFAALPCSCLKCSNAKNSDRDMWRSSWSTSWSYDAFFKAGIL